MAQTAPQDTGSAAQMGQRPSEAKLVFPVLVFDRARVVKQSQAGAALEARMAEAREALLAENDQIYADLEAEEQEISDAKSTMAEAEFRARAQAFDEKVTQVRQRQDEKARDIQTLYDEGLAEIDQQMNTVLTQIARDLGAVVVFERNQVYLMNGAIDISRIAIEKLDDREGAQAREQGSETASPTDAEQQETPPAQD
ncbi:OmpH family outer membrane protein [Celeribacter sp. HF31]|uniref:OmpH family outer membrane protein n=1 Tax=Celeribacter sp. HF31 TaxID=2721558 RepID=UPI001430E02B|nr:OmpH family outer membrane protein [Celeribacter sp. HF31]NIY81210.1 OmpH family outer membrane protein [Celeribacter sp. HF31]